MENSTATHTRHRPHTKRRDDSESDNPAGWVGRGRRRLYRAGIKRALDLLASLLLIVLLLPLMLVVAALVRLDSPGPVLFRQRRLGRNRVPFTVLKFRTMAVDSSPELHQRYIAELADSQPGENRSENGRQRQADAGDIKKLTSDPRVTAVGRFLRRVSLDELPQLFNVVGGSMSLIGPRPALEYELKHYRPLHFKRFDVRPGITGLWQVSGRNRLGFSEMLDLDVQYSENVTPVTDIDILIRTPMAALRHAA
jgi:lipopolysaccharide/colanic/teichoic acid biosynthesis glycosyltransferase